MRFFRQREKQQNIFSLSDKESKTLFRAYDILLKCLWEIPHDDTMLHYYSSSMLPADKMTMRCIIKKDFERRYPTSKNTEMYYSILFDRLAYFVDSRLAEAIKLDRQLNGDTTLNLPKTALEEETEMRMIRVVHEVRAEWIALNEEWDEFVVILKNAKENNEENP